MPLHASTFPIVWNFLLIKPFQQPSSPSSAKSPEVSLLIPRNRQVFFPLFNLFLHTLYLRYCTACVFIPYLLLFHSFRSLTSWRGERLAGSLFKIWDCKSHETNNWLAKMERVRAVPQTSRAPGGLGIYTQTSKIHMPHNYKFNKANHATSGIPVLWMLAKAGSGRSTFQGKSPAKLLN